MKGKTLIDKLNTHFDKDWKTQRSTLRQTLEERERGLYNPTSSWDARSDNPNSFSRLEHAVEVSVQTTRPITLSGAAVISLENPEGMSIYNVKRNDKHGANIPLTLEQRELGMIQDKLSAEIPQRNQLAENQVLIMDKGPTFRNMVLHGPTFKVETIPDYYVHHTAKEDKKNLTPAEKKHVMDFEQQKRAADRHIQKAVLDRQHTKAIMAGPMHHRGVLGVDTSDNPNSEIYGDKAKQQIQKSTIQNQGTQNKREYLAERGSSMLATGNILVPSSIKSTIKENPIFQSKGGDIHGYSFDETRDRLFKRDVKGVHPERTQHLRDQDLSGKNFNIVTHQAIDVWPSKIPIREHKTMAHPSQATLEGHRNLQGTLHTGGYF